jgi:hypothetical protein
MEFRPEVLSVVANRVVSWRERIPGVFTGEHNFTLERMGENKTRFAQRSTFTGLRLGSSEEILSKECAEALKRWKVR